MSGEKWKCDNCGKIFSSDNSFMRIGDIEDRCEIFVDACSKECVTAIIVKDLETIKNE